MSGFSDKEREAEADRRKAADLAKDVRPRSCVGPTAECIHCGRSFPLHEGHIGEVSLCDHCLHRD